MDMCRNFLEYYVKTSFQPMLVWGPDEQRSEQKLKTVSAVNNLWKTLIAAAQEHVLDEITRRTGQIFNLARRQGPAGASDTGPVAKISKVSSSSSPNFFRLQADAKFILVDR